MPLEIDCLVIGGGAAGVAAAAEASQRGIEVVVVDERREPPAGLPRDSAPGVTVLRSSVAWGVFPGGITSVVTPGDSLDLAPKVTIIAAGAHDRLLPFVGWEHQSVVTADEALEVARTLPAPMRWVVAGIGGQGLRLAHALGRLGQHVVYADALDRGADAEGATESLYGHVIAAVRGRDRIEEVELVPNGGGGAPVRRNADTVCVAYGRAPRTDLSWLAGCEMVHRSDLGGTVPQIHDGVRTSVEGVFAAGDAAGLCRAETAALEGRLAGVLAAVHVLGDGPADAEASRRTLAEQVQAARAADVAALSGWIRLMWDLEERYVREALERSDAFLCRCELVPGPAVRVAFDELASTPGDAKRATRAGMGECQGQHCRSLIARAAAARTGEPVAFDRPMSYRPPVRPITIAQLIDEETKGRLCLSSHVMISRVQT